jgi:hypothetical protein
MKIAEGNCPEKLVSLWQRKLYFLERWVFDRNKTMWQWVDGEVSQNERTSQMPTGQQKDLFTFGAKHVKQRRLNESSVSILRGNLGPECRMLANSRRE